MILIQERATKKFPGLTSLFLSFKYNKNIIDDLKLLEFNNYNENTKEWEIPISELSEALDRLSAYDDITLELLPDKPNLITYSLGEYKTTPFNHQYEAIQYGLNNPNWLLLDAPGLGKTLSIICLAKELKERYNIQHCLIICGLNTLKFNWKKEIEKHSNLSCRILGQRINKRGRLVVEGVSKRLEQLKNSIDEFFVITNVETIREEKIVEAIRKNKLNQFDMIVFDEIHVCKNPNSTQGHNLLKLTKAKYKIGATGTLLLNNPLDCYLPLKWIGLEKANYSSFKYYYGKYGGIFGQDLLGFRNLNTLKHQLESCSLRRTKDILNLPEKTIINEYIEMNKAQEDFYNNLRDGILGQIDKVHISNTNLLALVARLRQATACPSILTTDSIISSKMERAEDLIHQLVQNGEKVVVFSTFKETIYELQRHLTQYNLVIGTGDLPDDVVSRNKDKFQEDPNVQLFLGTWQKCGTGITLNAASYMIFMDVPWTNGIYEQAQDRIHRIGSNRPVFIYHLILKDTIDERVLEIVEDKEALSNYIIDDEITEAGLQSLRKYVEEL